MNLDYARKKLPYSHNICAANDMSQRGEPDLIVIISGLRLLVDPVDHTEGYLKKAVGLRGFILCRCPSIDACGPEGHESLGSV